MKNKNLKTMGGGGSQIFCNPSPPHTILNGTALRMINNDTCFEINIDAIILGDKHSRILSTGIFLRIILDEYQCI